MSTNNCHQHDPIDNFQVRTHLQWIHARLRYKYGENELHDYMQLLNEIINCTPINHEPYGSIRENNERK